MAQLLTGQFHVRPKESRLIAMTSGCHFWRVTRPFYYMGPGIKLTHRYYRLVYNIYGLHSTRTLCTILPGTKYHDKYDPFLTCSKLCCLLKVTLHGVTAWQRQLLLTPSFKYNRAKCQNNGIAAMAIELLEAQKYFY